jgi:MFS family permease
MAVVERRFPEWLRHAQAPGARTFAILGGIEAAARAILASVLPLTAYRAAGDAAAMSRIYLLVGLVSLAAAMIIPALGRIFRRRYLYTAGGLGLALAALLAGLFEGRFVLPALFVQAIGTVTLTICFNAYLMDYIQRTELGASESLRLFYSAAAWTVGPFLGVWLMEEVHYVAPFALSLLAALALILAFWWFRLGDGKAIARAVGAAPRPRANLRRLVRPPRQVARGGLAEGPGRRWVAREIYVPRVEVANRGGHNVGGVVV